MNKHLYSYLEREWRFNNHPKYYHYFKLWVENLTETQIYYFQKDYNKSKK